MSTACMVQFFGPLCITDYLFRVRKKMFHFVKATEPGMTQNSCFVLYFEQQFSSFYVQSNITCRASGRNRSAA